MFPVKEFGVVSATCSLGNTCLPKPKLSNVVMRPSHATRCSADQVFFVEDQPVPNISDITV